MRTHQEIKELIQAYETRAAELSFKLNTLDQRGYAEYGPELGDKLSKLEGKIEALKWVIN
jgi:hypothetical protein